MALKIQKTIGTSTSEGWILDILAQMYVDLERYDEATVRLRHVLKISRDFDQPRQIANALDSLGHVLELDGDPVEARQCLLEAIEIFESLNSPAADRVRTRLAGLPGK